MDLGEVLRKMFLSLDPLSLGNCKCVNGDWCRFIQTGLWESGSAGGCLHDGLMKQWKFGGPSVAVLGGGVLLVCSLVCDGGVVVCGCATGQAGAYDVYAGELVFQLQSGSRARGEEDFGFDEVGLDMGRTVMGSVTEAGWVSVFCKTCGGPLYQGRHHGERQTVEGVGVVDGCVLAGGGDGGLVGVGSVRGVWRVTRETFGNGEHMAHMDADGR